MKLQRFLLVVGVIASLGANAYFVLQRMTGAQDRTSLTHSALDQIEVMRTNGGLLQVSTIRSPELFQSTQDHTIFGIHVGKTTSQIRVPATFHYHVELAPEWKITVRNNTFIVIAPRVKPTLPVAIDTAKLEKLTSGTWSLLTGTSELDQLQKSITQSLAQKAAAPLFIQLQREAARKTVAEFVTQWVVEQRSGPPATGYTVRVFFADEPIEVLGSAPPPLVGTLLNK